MNVGRCRIRAEHGKVTTATASAPTPAQTVPKVALSSQDCSSDIAGNFRGLQRTSQLLAQGWLGTDATWLAALAAEEVFQQEQSRVALLPSWAWKDCQEPVGSVGVKTRWEA